MSDVTGKGASLEEENACQHERLRFHSGCYHIGCLDCGGWWTADKGDNDWARGRYIRPTDRALTPPAEPNEAADRLGSWMSAALDDPSVCAEMKADIEAWFAAGQPSPTEPPSAGREGWVLVPRELTPDMRQDVVDRLRSQLDYGDTLENHARRIWAKFLAAAPSPEPQPSVRLERVKMAMIIDPEAWRNEDGHLIEQVGAAEALAKADAIISSARPGGE